MEGSPPRVRGTGRAQSRASSPFRITPACAGNRGTADSSGAYGRDHPRVCGEQQAQAARKDFFAGSPPRVRGTGLCPGEAGRIRRITPACAGNSKGLGGCYPVKGDHPRVCGEQAGSTTTCMLVAGSPPRVRGTACRWRAVPAAGGITPACAGNSIHSRFPAHSG